MRKWVDEYENAICDICKKETHYLYFLSDFAPEVCEDCFKRAMSEGKKGGENK